MLRELRAHTYVDYPRVLKTCQPGHATFVSSLTLEVIVQRCAEIGNGEGEAAGQNSMAKTRMVE